MDFLDGLVRFEASLWNMVEHELIAGGQVGLGTLMALRVLHRHRGTGRVNEISRELALTIGAASKFVDRLERDGLARRTPHPTDRRSSLVTLTNTGDAARQAAEHVAARAMTRLIGDDEAVGNATAALVVLESRLNAAALERTP